MNTDLVDLLDEEPDRGEHPRAAEQTTLLPAAEAPGPAGDVDQEEPENLFASVVEFVSGFLSIAYARTVNAQRHDFRWCPRWWEHAEALSRLEALWKAFETLRQDPGTGAAVWWRDYCDPTMNALCGSEGAFRGCSDTEHKVLPDLPVEQPPVGFLEDSEVRS